MKYLVTGGLGVIGSRFVDVVIQAGHEATVIDSAEELRNEWTAARLEADYGERVHIIRQRVEDVNFSPLLVTHSAVLHAAAHTGIPHSEQDPTDDWVSNVEASRNILEHMRKLKSGGFHPPPTVMLSSVKPYRVHDLPSHVEGERTVLEGKYALGIDETCLLEPDEPYAASKLAQTGLVMAYARTYDIPVTVLRCSNLYGDAPCHGPRHGWLTWFCISAALGLEIEIQGTGFQTRDMLFSNDVASATLAAIDNIDKVKGNVYNIGGGLNNSISIQEAASLISRIRNSPLSIRKGPGRKNEDQIFVTDFSKFHFVTGWEPAVGVEEGVTRLLDWSSTYANDLRKMYEAFI